MIYAQLLNNDFDKLPRALRGFHSAPGGGHAQGMVAIERARGLIARLSGFPPSAQNLAARVDVVATEDREIWIRQFGDAVLRSVQRIKGGLLVERVGPLSVCFRVEGSETGMRFQLVRARLFGVPIPLHVEATATGSEKRWEFEVRIAHVGLYRGVMEPIE